MKTYCCQKCDKRVFFENTVCSNCNSVLGYEYVVDEVIVIEPYNGVFKPLKKAKTNYKKCKNHEYGVCNWLIPADDANDLCPACSLNQTIPDISNPEHMKEWKLIEAAKHRLIYSILKLKLPLINKKQDSSLGLAFEFLAEDGVVDKPEGLITGHANGLITLNVAEANSVHREYMKETLSENYRTLIGHFRHEVGHYYWDYLIAPNQNFLNTFRKIFGDERADYAAALQKHYANGAPSNWRQNFISEYATSHPWEDWAETWAHYFHILDILETAYYYGVSINPINTSDRFLQMKSSFNPYETKDFEKIVTTYLPLIFAVNSLNRSMGQPDLYPFILNAPIVDKLKFIHGLMYQKK